jgi:hypothetical protein
METDWHRARKTRISVLVLCSSATVDTTVLVSVAVAAPKTEEFENALAQ